jgi:hypothetical protein
MRNAQEWYHHGHVYYLEVVMPLLALVIAAILLIVGAVQLIEGAVLFGIVLILVGLFVGNYGRGGLR